MKKATVLLFSGAVGALVWVMPALAAAWPAETLSGKINMVDPGENIVVLKGTDGIPYDMVITPKTKIESGNQTLASTDLQQLQNKNASVKFVPESRGDVAVSIQVQG